MTPTSTIGRRNFLLGAATLTAAGAGGLSLASAATPEVRSRFATTTDTTTAWILKSDNWTSPRGYPLRTHCKCTGCVNHAANKIFKTLADADDPALRAHPGCLCEPAEIQLPAAVWTKLFGSAELVDRRDPTVAAIIAAGPVVVSPPSGPTSAPTSGPTSRSSSPPPVRGTKVAPAVGRHHRAASDPSLDVARGLRSPSAAGVAGIAATETGRHRAVESTLPSAPTAGRTSTTIPTTTSRLPLTAAADSAATAGSGGMAPWAWIGLPGAAAITGLWFLIALRRRREDEEPQPVGPGIDGPAT